MTQQSILSTDKLGAAWGKQLSMNSELYNSVGVNLSQYGNDLPATITAIGTETPTTLTISTAPNTLTADLTIPSNITLDWKSGCVLGGAYTLTINGGLVAGSYQLFDSATSVVGPAKITKALTAWFDQSNISFAIEQASTLIGTGDVFVGEGTYSFDDSAIIPIGITIVGMGRGSILQPSSTFSDTYLMRFNTTDGLSFDTSYPGEISGGAENLTFKNDNDMYCRTIVFAGSQIFKHLRFYNMDQSIVQAPNAYCDLPTMEHIHITAPRSETYYQITLAGSGDGFWLNQLHLPIGSRTTAQQGVYISSAANGYLGNVLNGDISISNCRQINIDNYHQETGKLTIDSSQVSVTNSIFQNGFENDYNVELKATLGGSFSTILSNCTFLIKSSDYTATDFADIKIGYNNTLQLRNTYKVVSENGFSSPNIHSIMIAKSDDSELTDFNDRGWLFRNDCFISRGYIVNLPTNRIDFGTTSFTGITSATLLDAGTFVAATDIYYYLIQIIYDTKRMVGRDGSATEKSIAVTNGGFPVSISCAFGRNQFGILKIYRGTSPGIYNQYAYTQIIAATELTDFGTDISGSKWVDRVPGDVDPVDIMGAQMIEYKDTSVRIITYGVPTKGMWYKRDRAEMLNPVDGGTNEWLCTFSLETTVATNALSGSTAIVVTSGTGTKNLDVVGVRLNSGGIHYTTIASGGGTTNLTLTSSLPADADAGGVVYIFRWKVCSTIAA